MWSLEKPRQDKRGRKWHFAYWHEGPRDLRVDHPQQLFYWDDRQIEYGVVLFARDKTVRYSSIRNWIEKLVADPELRKRHYASLRFPVQRFYLKNGFHAG